MAGAVRIGDDRGDGLRHARDRVRSRLGSGSPRRRRDRLHRQFHGRGHPRRRARPHPGQDKNPSTLRTALHGGAYGRKSSRGVSPSAFDGEDYQHRTIIPERALAHSSLEQDSLRAEKSANGAESAGDTARPYSPSDAGYYIPAPEGIALPQRLRTLKQGD